MEAFEATVDRYQRQVLTYARYLLGNREEAEDVTQEVFLRLWRHRRRVDADRTGAWLIRVTRNRCYDQLRNRRSVRRHFGEPIDATAAEALPSGDADPGSEAEAGEFRLRLRAALEKLGEPYKSVLVLREIEGLAYKEICEALDLPLNTVKVYIHRGRRRLRTEMEEVYSHG